MKTIVLFFLLLFTLSFLYSAQFLKLKGDIFFVNGDWVMFTMGKYQLIRVGDILPVYRKNQLIAKIEVRKTYNFYSKAKILELSRFYLKKGDIVKKSIPATDYQKLFLLTLNLRKLKMLQRNLKIILQQQYPDYDLKEFMEFVEWYYLSHGIIFPLKKGISYQKILNKWKNNYSPKDPIFFLFQSPSQARNFIIYDASTYNYWKEEVAKFEEYRKKVEAENKRKLEKRIFNLRRDRDIRLNPYFSTFVKYYGEPDKVIREVENLDFIRETCYWYDDGIWAVFINKKLVRQEKFKEVRR